jgi:LysM repeat protein
MITSRNSNSNPSGDTNESSIRPRNRRLVSTEQELVSTSATSTPTGSRAVSPIPAKHPSRSVDRTGTNSGDRNGNGNGNGRPGGGLLAPPQEGRAERSSPINAGGGGGAGIWDPQGWMNSWTTLQGLASSVLGGTEASPTDGPLKGGSVRRKAKEGMVGGGRMKLPDTWGPPSPASQKKKGSGIGMGSTEEREAAVRAKKMKRVLEGQDELPTTLDTNGNYKHRTSTEEQRPGSSQEDDQALVYIHHVQKGDTLAGVVLRYNCDQTVFKKANRLWSNDSIQVRKTVVLPVDACAIKGRPCDPPSPESVQHGIDLLAPTPGEDNPFSNGSTWPGPLSQNGTSAERPEDNENPWVHVRWVLIDSSPSSKPVEIARMPRKTLGYFPPRRRKSQVTPSNISTPRGSTEFPRISQSMSTSSNDPSGSTASTPSRRTSNIGARPSQSITAIGSYFPPLSSSTRPRRESVGEAAERMGWMRGPGGVGTFDSNVRRPGPAQDGLNKWARKHIPGIAIDSLPSTSIFRAETAHFGFSDELASIAEGPGISTNSGTQTPSSNQGGMGLENAAAAIEGWVRRLAIKTPGTPKGGGRIEAPDLIELLDGAGSDDGRGFELNPGHLRSSTPSGTGREDLDGVIRGRQSAGAKGAKSD